MSVISIIDPRSIKEEDILGYECINSTYSSNPQINEDALIVKENIHLKDGTIVPNIRIIKNKKWPFWVTRKGFRNHESQKEAEEITRLERFMSRRIDLPKNVMNVLNVFSPRGSMRDLSKSPYLYGTDVQPTSLIKFLYNKRYPNCTTLNKTVAGVDIETDVVWGTGEIIMNNITMHGKSYTAVTRKFAASNPNFIEKCYRAAERLLGGELERDKVKWEIELVDSPAQCVVKVLEKAHEWMPDFISIWNMNFDIPKMRDALLAEDIDPAYVFSDPRVPDEFKFFEYIEGKAFKKTQSGKTMSFHPAERWHTVTCPASFYFLDSMCLYKRIRTAGGNEPSYKLNDILIKNKLDPKLKIEEVEKYESDGDLWHYYMQRDYGPEYVVYNLIDDKRLIDLDTKVGDICRAFPTLVGISDFGKFHQNPRRIADDLHFFYLDRGKVFASTSPDLAEDPLDKYVCNMLDWIITLPSYMINEGGQIFVDAPEIRTMMYEFLSDLDIEGTYPNEELAFNISKKTTLLETSKIQGMTETQRRELSLNMTGGKSNALEICIKYFNYPNPSQLLDAYDKELAGLIPQLEAA